MEQDQGRQREELQKEMLGYVFQCQGCDMKFKTGRGLRNHQGRVKNRHCKRAAKMERLEKAKEDKAGQLDNDSDDSGEALGTETVKRKRIAYTKDEKTRVLNAVIQLEVEGCHRVEAMKRASKMLRVPVRRIRLFFQEKESKGDVILSS